MEELTPLQERVLNLVFERAQQSVASQPAYIRMTCEQRSELSAMSQFVVSANLKEPPTLFGIPVLLVNSLRDYAYREALPIPHIDLTKD